MIINIPKDKSKTKREDKKKVKICEYPNCGKEFEGRGKSKYCEEHRKKEYYKELYFNKYKNKQKDINEENQIINHSNFYSFKIKQRCSLDGCNNIFEIKLIPRINIYPKYCEEHRNEFKRKNFKK